MQLSQIEREQLYAILEKNDQHPKVQEMREFIQHGDVTTYQHCKNVTSICMIGTRPAASTGCAACSRCTAFPTPVPLV